ncbi:hypothetical protein ABBQ32_001447 [Trebouxia sp. C0010 RCD-2024]
MFSVDIEADLLARDSELEQRTRDLIALPAAPIQGDSNVRQAIEEVLARVNLADSQDASQVVEEQHSTQSVVEHKGTGAKPSKRAASSARSVLPPRVRRTASGKPQPPIPDTEVEGVGTELEVPNHPEATIRLHKARIKSLTAEVAAAQTALKDRSGLLTQAEKQLSEMHKEKAAWLKTQKAQQAQAVCR